MKRAILAVAVLTSTSGVASAGIYGGLAIGPAPAVHDNQFDLGPGGRTGRILGGYRLGRFSGELSLTGQGLLTGQGSSYDGRQYSLSAKYNLPIGDNFEVYPRLGVHRSSLSVGDSFYDVSGNGLLIGIGAEYRIKLGPKALGSLFLDYTYNDATVSNANYEIDYTTRQWMLGFTVGI